MQHRQEVGEAWPGWSTSRPTRPTPVRFPWPQAGALAAEKCPSFLDFSAKQTLRIGRLGLCSMLIPFLPQASSLSHSKGRTKACGSSA